MKHILVTLLFLLLQFSIFSQIYNKKVIYKYEIEHSSNNEIRKKQYLYLVCHGKTWKLDPNKQFSIDWVDEGKDVFSLNNGTGVIENSDTIWLHPPRHDVFYVHEFTPFPEVRLPLKEGKRWITDFGYVWPSKELGIPFGIKVKPQYDIEEKFEEYSDILHRTISCYRIVGTINNSYLKSKWIGVFNDEVGFIRMEFQNTNKSITRMNLVNTFDWDQDKVRFGLFSL